VIDKRAGVFLEEVMKRYADDAPGFARDIIGVELSENQQIPALKALCDPNGKKKVAIKSGHKQT